ncbi:GNAT family N-acetyltransferase, partial [Campylobacter jejuni]|uniref:GNAT family N-acetyltransferase n=1 Tax=Campylobacter jejuni TaxID=197 RepID=UPI003C6CE8DD
FEASWTQWWPLFEPHHYLKLPRPLGTFYVAATEDGSPVACVLVSTGAGLKWARMTRLVVLPEWQGAGVGVKFI